MADDKQCKLCREALPQVVIYRLNKLALREGFCSWGCLVAGMNETAIVALIKAERERERE